LGLENHGGLTATAEGTLRLVRDVKSPWFGAIFDSGNFHSADPYAELAKIAPYSINVHLKVTVSAAGKKQPTDYARLRKILTDVGYRGYITLEYEEEEDPRIACPRHLDEIRKAFS
jgi:sugar phosphate isomerase/epimerase